MLGLMLHAGAAGTWHCSLTLWWRVWEVHASWI